MNGISSSVAWACASAQASSVCSCSSSTVSTVGRSTSSGARGNVERFRGSLTVATALSALDAILGDLYTLDAFEAEEQLDQIHGGLGGDLLHDGAECFLHILTEGHALDRQAAQVDLDSLVGLKDGAHPTRSPFRSAGRRSAPRHRALAGTPLGPPRAGPLARARGRAHGAPRRARTARRGRPASARRPP